MRSPLCGQPSCITLLTPPTCIPSSPSIVNQMLWSMRLELPDSPDVLKRIKLNKIRDRSISLGRRESYATRHVSSSFSCPLSSHSCIFPLLPPLYSPIFNPLHALPSLPSLSSLPSLPPLPSLPSLYSPIDSESISPLPSLFNPLPALFLPPPFPIPLFLLFCFSLPSPFPFSIPVSSPSPSPSFHSIVPPSSPHPLPSLSQ